MSSEEKFYDNYNNNNNNSNKNPFHNIHFTLKFISSFKNIESSAVRGSS